MKRIATWTILACASSLAGCTGAAYSNRSLESVHQPVVRNSLYQFDVATANGELPPSEQGRLQGWLDAMGVRYGDRIAVEDPSAYGASSAQATVRAMVERRGLLLSREAPVTTGAVPEGYLRVVVTRASASVPGCPNWDSKSSLNSANATSSNYGCAVNSNLAGMVANPEHLVQGAAGDGGTVVMSSNKAIDSYREAKPTGEKGLKANSTESGK